MSSRSTEHNSAGPTLKVLKMTIQTDLELDLKLRFPNAFRSDSPQQFAFRCGAGWFAIVGTLCSLLSEANAHIGHAPTHLVSVVEKMGTLRVLKTGHDPRANEWVRFAERHATHTCEICGANGRLLYADGWQRVRCEPHKIGRAHV